MSDKMTIASALRKIKKIKGQIAEYKLRAEQSVSYVHDKIPAFPFNEQLRAYIEATSTLLDLESKVAVANSEHIVLDGNKEITLAEAIRTLQEIKGMISFYKGLNLRSGIEKNRVSEWDDDENRNINRVEEILYVCELSEVERDAEVKRLQDHFEDLNNIVEDKNHTVFI